MQRLRRKPGLSCLPALMCAGTVDERARAAPAAAGPVPFAAGWASKGDAHVGVPLPDQTTAYPTSEVVPQAIYPARRHVCSKFPPASLRSVRVRMILHSSKTWKCDRADAGEVSCSAVTQEPGRSPCADIILGAAWRSVRRDGCLALIRLRDLSVSFMSGTSRARSSARARGLGERRRDPLLSGAVW